MEEVTIRVSTQDGLAYAIEDGSTCSDDEFSLVCLTREDAQRLAADLAAIAPALLTQDELSAATAIEQGLRALRPRSRDALTIMLELLNQRYADTVGRGLV